MATMHDQSTGSNLELNSSVPYLWKKTLSADDPISVSWGLSEYSRWS